MSSYPTGTVTFLFTDIEGSTRLAQEYPEAIAGLLDRHHTILKGAIEAQGGYVFQVIGDAFCAAFQTAGEALRAAIEAQRSFGAENWLLGPVRVRMGLSTGSAQIRLQDGRKPDYSGYISMARVQRIMSLAHGGQILISGASAELLRTELQPNVTLHDLGEHRLKGLQQPEHLWQIVAPGLQRDFPPLPSLGVTPNNLPAQLTSFIGRQHEIADVKKLLETHRLVTLTGSGGTGKTRLSLQIAADILEDYPDGVWLVELAPVRDGSLISQTILHVLGLLTESGRQPLDILTEYLSGKKLLILLDNCEHVLAESGSFVEAVLQAAPAVKVLATSREILNLAGEQAYRVPSLQAPDINRLPDIEQLGRFEAIQLFVERVTLVSPGFTITQNNALALAQICRRLDGIPLAIELAAARVKSMPLEAMLSRLDDRFRLLTGGSRNTLPRQQTLRATIDWSYALLTEPEKLLLQRLSVFRGGCTLVAAEAVCGREGIEERDVLDLLSKLVDKSLLNLDEAGRYQILETVRQYGGEKLIDVGQAEWARDRHLHFMLDLAELAEPQVRGRDQVLWLNRLEEELENWRAALAWAQDRGPELFLRLAAALWRFWAIRVNNSEIIDWLEDALRRTPEGDTVIRARVLARLAFLHGGGIGFYTSEGVEQYGHLAYTLGAKLHDEFSKVIALDMLSLCLAMKKSEEAASLAQQSLEIARRTGDHWLIGDALFSLGVAAMTRNDLRMATAIFEEAVVEARLSGDNRFIANGLMHLAWMHRARGHGETARALLHEALSIGQSAGDRVIVMAIHSELALVALFSEEYSLAEQQFGEALVGAEAVHHRMLLAKALQFSGLLEWARRNALGLCEREQNALGKAQQAKDPLVTAEALCLLAEGHRLKGETELARLRFTEALTAAKVQGFRPAYCYSIQGLGALALACRDAERATRLFAARAKLRETTFAEDYYPFMVREREAQLAEARALLGEEAFNAAWAAAQVMSEQETLAYALGPS